MNSVGSRWPLLVYAFIVWTVFGSENTFPAIELSIGKRAPLVVAPTAPPFAGGAAAPHSEPSTPPAAAPAAVAHPTGSQSGEPRPVGLAQPEPDSTAGSARPAPAATHRGMPASDTPARPGVDSRNADELGELEDSLQRDARGTSPTALVPRPAPQSPLSCQPRPAESWVSRDWTRGFADGWPRGMQYPHLPVSDDPRLARYIGYFTGNPEGRKTFATWLRRSGKYGEVFTGILRRRKLPLDLIAVAFVESGLWPTAVSKAGATGLWQFMPETARAYGLHVDDAFDERRSIWRSTEAAADHLRDLYEEVGSWELALAAYNMGAPRLTHVLEEAGTADFWAVSRGGGGLPHETALYVPKVLAVSVILNNLSYFGFDDVQPLPALDAKAIRVPPGVALTDVARAAGTTVQFLRELNPQLTGESTPELAREVDVYVPRDPAEAEPAPLGRTASRASELRSGNMAPADAPMKIGSGLSWLGHVSTTAFDVPNRADLLRGYSATLLKRAVPQARLAVDAAEPDPLLPETGMLSWAGWIRNGSRPAATGAVWRIVNDQLLLDPGSSEAQPSPPGEAFPAGPAVIQYRVVLGDTLWSIARSHGTSERRIAKDNRISEASVLNAGQVLTVRSTKALL